MLSYFHSSRRKVAIASLTKVTVYSTCLLNKFKLIISQFLATFQKKLLPMTLCLLKLKTEDLLCYVLL